jgi:tRNA nucleotidyltransferase (CCA-adding enzyme)
MVTRHRDILGPEDAARKLGQQLGTRPLHLRVIQGLAEAGHEVYIIGGAVRDLLLDREPHDLDLATDARPEDIVRIFQGQRVRVVGKAFNITLVNGVEVASYRSPPAHPGCSGEEGARGDLIADLERRDLTINSMALCPQSGGLVDPFGGRADLEYGVVRLVRDPQARIDEDPCRMVRACRFASNIGGVFAPDTLFALRENAHLVGGVAPERLRQEVLKAMGGRLASLFFRNLLDIGALGILFPSLSVCVGHHGGKHHGEEVFEHCMLAGDAISPRCPLTRLAGYLHDVGKPVAAERDAEGRVLHFVGHARPSAALVERDLRTLAFSNQEIAFVSRLVRVHMHTLEPGATPRSVRRLLARLEQYGVDYRAFLRLRFADRKANTAKPARTLKDLRDVLQRMEDVVFQDSMQQEFSLRMLAVDGRDLMRALGLQPGPEVGRILAVLLERVLEEPGLNRREALLELAAGLVGPGSQGWDDSAGAAPRE